MDTQALPMIGVTLIEDFVKNPPPYFQVQHCVRHPVIRPVPELVNLCAHDKSHDAWFPDSMGKLLKIETVEQYDDLVNRMLTRPLVFDVKLERRHKSGRIRYILKCDIIVTVNTAHPVIRGQMQRLFDGGREDIVAGRNFAIDFNFDTILKDWFRTVHQGQDNVFDTSYSCNYARVVVTNCSEFNKMYSCSPEGVCLFFMCLPFCLVMCPVYRLSRCLTTIDRDTEVQGEVSYLTFKQQQRGSQDQLLEMLFFYALRNLFRKNWKYRPRVTQHYIILSRCLTTIDRDTEVQGDVSYLTFKQQQRGSQDQLLEMFRQYLLQQLVRQGRPNSDEAFMGLPEVRQPGSAAGGVQHRPPPPHPAQMFQPPYTNPLSNSGQVEHPVSPYGFQPPPPAEPGYGPGYAPPPHQMAPPPVGAQPTSHIPPPQPYSPTQVTQQPYSRAPQPYSPTQQPYSPAPQPYSPAPQPYSPASPYPQQSASPSEVQPELPSYDYVMNQSGDQDKLVT